METVKGYVEHIVFRNEDNGYTVFNLNNDDGDLTCVGNFNYLSEGELVEVNGEYVVHSVYGTQLRVLSYEIKAPEDLLSIERYLGSGAIKGVGASLAGRIVKKFREDTFRIIEEEPERLAEVRGISERMAREIAVQVEEKKDMRKAMIYLQKFGISTTLAAKIYQFYGSKTYQVLEGNPYQLADQIQGIGFKIADEIATKIGIHSDSDFRIRSGIFYTLQQSVAEGHVYLTKDVLIRRASALLEVEIKDIEKYLMDLSMEKKIVLKESEEGLRVYISHFYYLELNTAKMLHDLNLEYDEANVVIENRIHQIEKEVELQLDEKQENAVIAAVRNGIMILTGGPGTGKTTTINAMIEYFHRENMEIMLAAPTGRAAKRMTEATGWEAQTIHRLLEAQFDEATGRMVFFHDEDAPLACDAMIVDETSMVDLQLMASLLKALKPGCRLLLVGDPDQLPPVGAGNVFSDLIRSGVVQTVRLTEIFRQAQRSLIVMNAHAVNQGELPVLTATDRDFFFLRRRDPAAAVKTIQELCQTRLPKNMGIQPSDIQVLSPSRKHETGTKALNLALQAVLNPPAEGKKEKKHGDFSFRTGDRVMQIRNNYDIMWKRADGLGAGTGIFNGDIGTVLDIDFQEETMSVQFDDRTAEYAFDMLSELEPAYAMTVHKSQGSEYRAVILSLCGGPQPLLTRSVLYTAITRARELLIIVGNEETVAAMTRNDRRQRRYSGLKLRLEGKV